MVQGLFLRDNDLRLNAFEMIKKEITSATSSMTSIPRPLKFLRAHYKEIKDFRNNMQATAEPDITYKQRLSELLSVLFTVIAEGDLDTDETMLKYVLDGTRRDITSWGAEYVRSLCADIGNEYTKRLDEEKDLEDLYALVKVIVPFLIKSHCENDAIDLLIEVDKINEIMDFVTEANYKKICLYLLSMTNFSADTEEYREMLELTYNIYFNKFKLYEHALRVAMKMDNQLYIKQTFNQCADVNKKKQLAFILANEKIHLKDEKLSAEIEGIMSGLKNSEFFRIFAKSMEMLEPKHPEILFKTHLEDRKDDDKVLESYKINMAYSIASSFINAGYGTECLLSEKNGDWINKNKEEGLSCLIGGLGLINLWDDVEGPGKLIDYAGVAEKDAHKRAGRNIGMGVCLSSIHDPNDIGVALLLEELKDKNLAVKSSAIFGLGLAASGTKDENLIQPLLDVFQDFQYGFEVSALISLAFGLIFIGTANEDVFNELFSILLARNDGGKGKIFESPFFTLYALGFGLICLNKQKDTDFMIETLVTIEEFPKEMREYLRIMLTSFAYAGTGNVAKIQELMHIIAMKPEEVNAKVQVVAVIGCSLIAMGEEIGAEMMTRTFDHFLQFGEPHIKKAVSLAYALLNLSNPKVQVIDSIIKFCYDNDKDVAMCAIFGMGLVASGSNHSRVAGLYRSLASYYCKEVDQMLSIRIAQGLVHMGKGLLTLDPIHSHKLLISKLGLAGVLISICAYTESEGLICGKHQYLLYSLALAIRPKMVMTVNEKLEQEKIQVMIGQAVDIAGQTGNPRTITGFQTHTCPAVLSTGERCEFNGEEFKAHTEVLEGVVIMKEAEKKEET